MPSCVYGGRARRDKKEEKIPKMKDENERGPPVWWATQYYLKKRTYTQQHIHTFLLVHIAVYTPYVNIKYIKIYLCATQKGNMGKMGADQVKWNYWGVGRRQMNNNNTKRIYVIIRDVSIVSSLYYIHDAYDIRDNTIEIGRQRTI